MIERNDDEGYTVAYLDANWEPTDADSAATVKVVYDDGRVMFLSDPGTAADTVSEGEPTPQPMPTDEPGEHEHDGKPFDKHRTRYAKKRLVVYGKGLAEWAQQIAVQEAERIKTAISVGLTAGEDNTDIAHRVIGSRRANGVEGATEITRQHFLRLGKGLLQKRKTRMSGDSPDVRRV